jgi:short-subunit dehydrogenase
VIKALHLAKDQNGQIDMAVLNAGIYQPVNAAAFELSVYHQHMAVNYTGILNCLDGLIPEMVARKSGHIAFMASVAGYRGLPRSAAYGPTKAAVQNLAESIYFDLAPLGIKIQLINPGFVETEATAVNDFIMPDLISSEVAAKQLFEGLCSDQFEIAFPKRFVRKMKWLRLLPANSYLKLIAKLTGHQHRG